MGSGCGRGVSPRTGARLAPHPRRGLLASSLDLRCTRKSALDLPPGKLRSDPPSSAAPPMGRPIARVPATGGPQAMRGVDEAGGHSWRLSVVRLEECPAEGKTLRRAEPAASGRKVASVAFGDPPASRDPFLKRPCTERVDAPRPARRQTEAYPPRYGEGGQRSRSGCSGPRMPGSEGMDLWRPASQGPRDPALAAGRATAALGLPPYEDPLFVGVGQDSSVLDPDAEIFAGPRESCEEHRFDLPLHAGGLSGAGHPFVERVLLPRA